MAARICSSSSCRRVVDLDVEHEAVELGFGQRVGAFLLDRVLRGDGEERIGERIGRLADGRLAFLHRLQQRGLGLGRRAVDFVGQQQVGEDRPFDEAERPPAVLVFLQHVGARDVGGHQVGRELDALELEIEDLGQRADDQRLGQAWHADQQAMAAGEDRGENLLDHGVLANDHLLQLALHDLPMLPELLQHVAEIAGFAGGHREQGC